MFYIIVSFQLLSGWIVFLEKQAFFLCRIIPQHWNFAGCWNSLSRKENINTAHSQWHGCWCPGDTKSQDISSNELVILWYYSLGTGRFNEFYYTADCTKIMWQSATCPSFNFQECKRRPVTHVFSELCWVCMNYCLVFSQYHYHSCIYEKWLKMCASDEIIILLTAHNLPIQLGYTYINLYDAHPQNYNKWTDPFICPQSNESLNHIMPKFQLKENRSNTSCNADSLPT